MKSSTITFKISSMEKERIRKAGKKVYLSLSSFIRKSVLDKSDIILGKIQLNKGEDGDGSRQTG